MTSHHPKGSASGGKGDLEQATACRECYFGGTLLFIRLRGLAVQVLTFEEWVKEQERLVLEYFGIGGSGD